VGECDTERPCELSDGVCDDAPYSTCEWCDLEEKECNPGCETDDNCAGGMICNSHNCQDRGVNGVVNITISTESCSQCAGSANPFGYVEGGLRIYLEGDYGTFCQSHNLDNLEKVDYDNGMTAFFDGAPDDDGDDDGMGECKGADLNYGLNGGTATWTGEGTWTGTSSSPVCIKFYDPDNNKPTCCCDLADTTLEQEESTDLVNCGCVV